VLSDINDIGPPVVFFSSPAFVYLFYLYTYPKNSKNMGAKISCWLCYEIFIEKFI